MRTVLMLVVFSVGCFGCGGHDHDEPEGTPSGATCPEGNALTYETFGRTFMSTYCTRCHSSTVTGAARQRAPAGHDYDTLSGILSMPEHIDEHAAAGPKSINSEMPSSGAKPTDDERLKLGQWLACEVAKR